jgi:hypothetical protein
MSKTQTPTDTIDVIERNEDVFKTIRDEADDPRIAHRFGRRPLGLLELARAGGDQS